MKTQTRTGIVAMLAILAAMTGCSTQKKITQTPEIVPIHTNTNIKEVHTERIDTVFIEIPSQSAERTTPKGVSHLETEYAESDAKINDDGTLHHTLNNKPNSHPATVKNTRDTVYIDKFIEKPVEVKVPVEVERELTWWERTRLESWKWLVLALIVCTGFALRKPIKSLIRFFIKKP